MIPEVNPYNNYRGDGVATLFDYDFFIQNGSQLIVEHIDENDVVTRLEENIDYEIVVIEEEFAGYIKFPIEDSKFGILQENETLSLQLTLPFEQISEYGQSSLLDLNSIEFSLDYLTRLCQILKRQMERSVRVNEGSEATPEQLLETINNNAIVSTNAAAIASKKADEAMESANVAINASEEIDNKINGFNESYESIKEEIIEEGEKQLQNVKSTGFYMRDDKLYFINSKGEEEEFKSGGSGFNLGDIIITDHILMGDEAVGKALQGTYVYKNGGTDRVGYPDFYTKWLAKKEAATPTEVVLADSPITMYIASNGHQFYDIADKSVIDTFYNTWGIADFYGIDEENERIFLPRNKYFMQLTDDTSKVNQMVEAGMPNVTQSFTAPAYTNVSGDKLINTTLGGSSVGSTNLDSTMKENSTWDIDFSRANEIYGNSNTVQPPSSLKLLYYCVGNTQVTESISNVTEITTSENDTLPWGYNFYSGDLLEAPVGHVQSLGQWNSGNDWQSFYDRAVTKIGQAFANGYIKNHTETYDEYDLVINQDDMTFRLPIFNGSETIPNLEAQQVLTVVTTGTPVNIPYNGFLRVKCTDSTYVNINQLPMGASNAAASTFTINEFSGLLQKGEAIPYFTGTMTNMYFIPARGNGKLYFKLANAVQDLNLLKVGEMTNGLANKVDLSNTNWAIRACMPDYTAGVTKSNNVDYTAEVAGLLVTRASGNKNCYVYINRATVGVAGGSAVNVNYNNEFFVDKNDTYKCANWDKITFYPLKGAN